MVRAKDEELSKESFFLRAFRLYLSSIVVYICFDLFFLSSTQLLRHKNQMKPKNFLHGSRQYPSQETDDPALQNFYISLRKPDSVPLIWGWT